MSRAEELRNDLENLHFICRYYIGILAELEQLGRTHTSEFKTAEKNIRVLKNNIRRIEAELEAEETRYFDEEYFAYLPDGTITNKISGEVVARW